MYIQNCSTCLCMKLVFACDLCAQENMAPLVEKEKIMSTHSSCSRKSVSTPVPTCEPVPTPAAAPSTPVEAPSTPVPAPVSTSGRSVSIPVPAPDADPASTAALSTPAPAPASTSATSDAANLMSLATPTVSAAPVTVTPRTLAAKSYTLVTQLEHKNSRKKYTVTANPKQGRYKIRLPAALTGTGKRQEITFKKTVPFGVQEDFGEFLYKELRGVVGKWKSSADAGKWFQNHRMTFKNKVETKYKARAARQSNRQARMRTFNAVNAVASQLAGKLGDGPAHHIVSPLVSAGQRATYSVCLPDFPELRTAKSKAAEVQAIRIGSRVNIHNRNAPMSYIYLPGALLKKPKGQQFSLGARHGTNAAWVKFVWEYIVYIVSKWKTFSQAATWVNHHRKNFIAFVQALWELRGGNHVPVSRNWVIKRSTLPPDMEYVKKGWFPKEAAHDPGMGLWCTKAGMHTFEYSVVDGISEVVDCDSMTHMQGFYGANLDAEGNNLVVPTQASFDSGVLVHTFVVGHRRENPTHKAVYTTDGRALLVPARPSVKGEEYCFNYKYHTPGARDYTTRNPIS